MSETLPEKQAAKIWRLCLVALVLLLVCGGVFYKMATLFTTEQEFLQKQGNARFVRSVEVPALRGVIFDRRGQALAVNAPIDSIWVNPSKVDLNAKGLPELAKIVGMTHAELLKLLKEKRKQGFLYLKHKVEPVDSIKVKPLRLAHVGVERKYQRYYPSAEVVSQIVGFTGHDGKGAAGLEYTFNTALTETIGKQTIYKDRLEREVERIRFDEASKPGEDIHLTIDMRLQYLAYRELKAAVTAHGAKSGSLVMLDVKTGEVLAMANAPSFNPNDFSQRTSDGVRNRAAIDLYEPGSTMKPLTIAAALMSGEYQVGSSVDTAPGRMLLNGQYIRDPRSYGEISLQEIIRRSSNVGVSKVALSLEPGTVRNLYENLGFGQSTGVGLQSEQPGRLPFYSERQLVERAQLSFGYGLSVTPLQLAASYLPIAGDGTMPSIKLIETSSGQARKRVMPEGVATTVRHMMKAVVSDTGTAKLAKIDGYTAAGKTGTVHVVGAKGYERSEYVAHFIGMVPASNPRIVMAVVMNQPKGQEHFGGEVSAPIFSRVASETMRLLNVAPDNLVELPRQVVAR